MLLNNFYRLLAYRSCLAVKPVGSMALGTGIRTADGTLRTTHSYGNSSSYYYSMRPPFFEPYPGIKSQTVAFGEKLDSNGNLIIGSGTTPATADDYRLESEITDVTYITQYKTVDASNGSFSILKTFRNDTEETKNVSEVGYTEPFMVTTDNNAYQLLTVREVYDTPIVVAPGETFSVTLNVQFPLPA